MNLRVFAAAVLAGVVGLAAAACGGAPRQAEVPDVDKESGVDMPGGEVEAPAASGDEPAAGPSGEAEMQTKCCVECKAGADKDRSGTPKASIPCADFTDTLSPWCLEHFRSKPAMASECT